MSNSTPAICPSYLEADFACLGCRLPSNIPVGAQGCDCRVPHAYLNIGTGGYNMKS